MKTSSWMSHQMLAWIFTIQMIQQYYKKKYEKNTYGKTPSTHICMYIYAYIIYIHTHTHTYMYTEML